MSNSSRQVVLGWHDYGYLPYEKRLAEREAETVAEASVLARTRTGLALSTRKSARHLWRLVYFSEVRHGGKATATIQSLLERSCPRSGGTKRQATRYSVHAVHDYKGRFNPQIVRSVLNILGVPRNSRVLDPFCGSGTSLVEFAYGGFRPSGVDLNPLAVYIAESKMLALQTPASEVAESIHAVRGIQGGGRHRCCRDDRDDYLTKWFRSDVLDELESLRANIGRVRREHEQILLTLLSDLLRDYSDQEPNDLRIRRRRSPYPNEALTAAFFKRADMFVAGLGAAQQVVGPVRLRASLVCADSATHTYRRHYYAAAVTSPPYATALPYIDTQRLSLVWLDLVKPTELQRLEERLLGSRDVLGDGKTLWQRRLEENGACVPDRVWRFCLSLADRVGLYDGFRRRLVPLLLYRYLAGMSQVFENVARALKPASPFAIVVGTNHTTLNGKKMRIDTPELLCEIAQAKGWLVEEVIPLQTYQRYGLHSRNSIRQEKLLILRAPA